MREDANIKTVNKSCSKDVHEDMSARVPFKERDNYKKRRIDKLV